MLPAHNLGANVPVVQEEAILEENVEDEVGKAFHSHAEEVLAQKVPVVGVRAVVFTWGAGDRVEGCCFFTCFGSNQRPALISFNTILDIKGLN